MSKKFDPRLANDISILRHLLNMDEPNYRVLARQLSMSEPVIKAACGRAWQTVTQGYHISDSDGSPGSGWRINDVALRVHGDRVKQWIVDYEAGDSRTRDWYHRYKETTFTISVRRCGRVTVRN